MRELYESLATFQQEVPAIYKATSGYGYKYADWGQILKVINPVLSKNNLGFTQVIEGEQLKTIVFHTKSGLNIESSITIPQNVSLKGMNEFQVMGSALTYLRRYSLSTMLGLVTDEDSDAAGEQVKKETTKKETKDKSGADQEILARAKRAINVALEKEDYKDAQSKIVFITSVLEKATIDTLDDADAVMDAIENIAVPANTEEPGINQDGGYGK